MQRSTAQSRLLHGENFVYACPMASDRMMQAISTLERAIEGLEQQLDGRSAKAPPSHGVDVEAAHSALASLDELIAELKGKARG